MLDQTASIDGERAYIASRELLRRQILFGCHNLQTPDAIRSAWDMAQPDPEPVVEAEDEAPKRKRESAPPEPLIRPVILDEAIAHICSRTGVDPFFLLSSGKRAPVVAARWRLIRLLARLGFTPHRISRHLDLHHTTVLHALGRIA